MISWLLQIRQLVSREPAPFLIKGKYSKRKEKDCATKQVKSLALNLSLHLPDESEI